MNDKDIPIQINKGYNTRKLQQKENGSFHTKLYRQLNPHILLTHEHNNGNPFDKNSLPKF